MIPEAEKGGVRMTLYPNDPPARLTRDSGRIMGTLAGESNGITFDCRVTCETGKDPMAVASCLKSLAGG